MGHSDRTSSESSDDIDIRPLEFEDLKRRFSSSYDSDDDFCHMENGHSTNLFFSAVMSMKRSRANVKPVPCKKPNWARLAWQNAARKALAMGDPWEKFNLPKYKTEKAKRHRYNALKQQWVVDEVLMKMEKISFNHGAMRECFRMKKFSNFCKEEDWSKAHNYVAKRYMSEVPSKTYFDDVKLQMDAKLWGEEFNRHNPPKKVDIFQMAILEMIDRTGSPVYHIEHYIEGQYVKYNSNSGFVRCEAIRMTPQAFSHFSFERSGHELIVVDIQGVGDLYTDPQIHTVNGEDYGDGNLGTRGIALFLHSHICNSICRSLNLTQFDLFKTELEECMTTPDKKSEIGLATVIRGTEEHVILPNEVERNNIQQCIRLRSLSSGYISIEDRQRIDSIGSLGSDDSYDDMLLSEEEHSVPRSPIRGNMRFPRIRYDSICDFGDNSTTKAYELKKFKDNVDRKSRPSHIMGELEHQKLIDALAEDISDNSHNTVEHSVLGNVHLDIAKYHELNRFIKENETYDHEAALFHLNCSAKCGNLDAILAMAQIHLGLTHDVLPDIDFSESERDAKLGFDYLISAANAGDRASMITVAKAFDTGFGLPLNLGVDWTKAVHWYSMSVSRTSTDNDGNYDSTMNYSLHQILASEAHLYWKGGNGLDKDVNRAGELFTEAAEQATEAMKGKMASKYYCLAEEAWAETDE